MSRDVVTSCLGRSALRYDSIAYRVSGLCLRYVMLCDVSCYVFVRVVS